ncbi:5'-3' DNA helicase ZGRF1 isoform X1 [Ranitomeya variabilis]|uniref:5'-3' DNA helicase ZGRF1 isoform X1 n=1 Tax=Ranitomeya variabilis TaxID=490064 RepID=UPI0040571A08
MAAQVYTVLYTHQKTKKAKVWQDGILKISGGQQAALYSDNGQRLDTVFVKTGVMNSGDEMESDRYLITVEAVGDSISSTSSSTENKDVQNFSRGALKPICLQPRAGLKRKFTGFKVPREIPKRPSLQVEKTAAPSSHQLAHGCSSQPPQFSATSPLFAASYGNQENKDKAVNCSSKHKLATATDLNVQENIFPGNFSASQEQTTITGSVQGVKGERVNQNPRSTAQILALLNILPIQKGPVAAQVPTGVSNLCSNELQRTTSTVNAPGGTQLCPLPSELSHVRTNPMKSRWDVYLDSPADSSLSQIDHEDFELPFNQGKPLDNHAPVEVRVLERNEDLVDNKQQSDSYISVPDLSNSPSLTPETLAATDFIPDNENNDGAFAEITFNLTDSFDFTELDDADSSESQVDSAKEHADLTERQNLLQNKKQKEYNESLKNHMENDSLHENNSTVPELSCMKAESEFTIKALLERPSTKAKAGDTGHKTEVMSEVNVLQTVEKRILLFPNKAMEGRVPSRQIIFQPDDPSKQKAAPKNLDDTLGYLGGEKPPMLTNAIIHHSVQGSTKDCKLPELWPSGSSISLLKSLSKPRNALESLKLFSEGSTAQNTDSKAQPYLKRVEKKDLYRLSQREKPLAATQDYQATPSCSAQLVSHHLPVEIQSYKLKGSVSSAVITRRHNPVLICITPPDRRPYPASCSRSLPSPTCILGDITKVSSSTSNEKTTSFTWNIHSESVCSHSPGPYDAMQNCLPEWTVGTPGSDWDWESSQHSANESNKVKTPTQNSSEKIHRFFLRPKLSNVAENPPVQSQDSLASLQQPYIVKSIKKVQSSLIKDLTEVSVSEDEVDDAAYNTPSTFSLGNNRHMVSQEIVSSKWTVYERISPESAQIVDKGNSDFCPQSVFRSRDRTYELPNNDLTPTASPHLASLKGRFGYHNHRDNGSGGEIITQFHTPSEHFRPLVQKRCLHSPNTGDEQVMLTGELGFPCRQTVLPSSSIPKREIHIPVLFKSSAHYKQVFSACLAEHLNIIMYELSQRLHKAFSKVDMSFYTSSGDETLGNYNAAPICLHQQRAKLVMVRKEGPNKGRFFFACDAPKARQCKFFKWLDELKVTHKERDKPESRVVLADMKSLSSYVRCQNISLYEESQLIIRKISTFPNRQYGKFTKFASVDSEFGGELKTKLYLKLNRKDHSSAYSKDDLWIVSRTLNFDPQETFIACSVFFGPSANNDIEILPLKGYSPSNWPINTVVHALLVCNASSELTCLRNIEEHFNPSSLPIMPHLLMMSSEYEKPTKIPRGKFNPPAVTAKVPSKCNIADHTLVLNVAREMITQFSLNEDQARAMLQIAHMMAISDEFQGPRPAPITIIHGVFGAGKSYLLAVVVLFLVHLFETHNPPEEHGSVHWKLLISSSTNVAVDRVLLGLLNLGFDQFIRVGSIRKIAKPILPHSLHAGSENESEQLKELQALLKEDLTPGEKAYVRKSIELHKLGTNKSMLRQVRVVGATCAACPFTCLSNLKFPVVILDECSQMTEPSSLLPIARFQCEKLIMVGDPKQLSPTLQGSEAAHEYGLEQTLFNRLCLMGHEAVMLRTQYRCHPSISAVANDLFYEGNLLDGISAEDRKPLLDWLPTLCFYNANGSEQVEGNASFYNVEEANFTVKLIQSLIASGIHGSMIGVITLYRSQMNKICCMLSSAAVFDPSDMKAVQVSTVDAFQGAEKEIIILSCVRTKQVGFIDSEKRMNVALTRGKRHLLIVGRLACLRKNKLWEQVIHHCELHKDGLKHVSQWDERLNAILTLYQKNKEAEEALCTQRTRTKTKAGKT